jgi:hypothetical protein
MDESADAKCGEYEVRLCEVLVVRFVEPREGVGDRVFGGRGMWRMMWSGVQGAYLPLDIPKGRRGEEGEAEVHGPVEEGRERDGLAADVEGDDFSGIDPVRE